MLFLYSVFFRLLILLSMFVSGTILACSANETCIEKSSWHLGIALGVGVKTNPLVDGDDIPLVILPDIAVSPEFPGPSDPADEGMQTIQRSLSIDEIASRKWAVNGGFRGHYFSTFGEWQLALLQDISNVHKGQLVALQYRRKWLWRDWQMRLRLGTDWKSAALLDYYYGVSKRDTTLTEYYFNGKSGWQTYLSIDVLKPINENWSWLAKMSYRRLPNSLTDSPLIEENNIRNVFLGVAYRF